MITRNGRQFTDKKIVEFYVNLGIKPITSLFEHLQNESTSIVSKQNHTRLTKKKV